MSKNAAVTAAIEEFVTFINNPATKPFGYWFESDTPGPKYTRIVMKSIQASVHAFVDNATGDLLKAATWKAPAKGARGNLLTGMGDIKARFDWAGSYLYLR